MLEARKAMEASLAKVRSTARGRIEELRASYASNYDLGTVPPEGVAAFNAIFDAYLKRADAAKSKREAEALPGQLQSNEAARILAIVSPKPVDPTPPTVGPGNDDENPPVETEPPKQPRTVSARSLWPRGWGKPILSTPEDARDYADEVRRRIEQAIANGDIVTS